MLRRPPKKLTLLATVSLLLTVAAANWFVHQPRHWQQAQAARIPDPISRIFIQIGHATADFTDAQGVTGSDNTVPFTNSPPAAALLFAGLAVRTDANAPKDIVVLNRKGFIVGYSPSLRHPVWVAYKTHRARNPERLPRPSGFKADPEAKNSPKHKDYTKVGYDRGHMAPNHAIASRYGKEAQDQTFLMSNVCPQRPDLNQGPWRDLELRISEIWPDRYGDIWVIVGAVTPPEAQRLPAGISIPTAFYQIVVTQERGSIRAFAVYMPQTIPRRAYVRSTLVSIDEIEQITGLDFLADLPDDVENALEAAVPTRLWPTGLQGLLNLQREHTRTYD